MKKMIALMLAATMTLSLAACGGETAGSGTSAVKDAEPLTFGEPITTENFEFTPVFGGFAEGVSNWPDKDYLTPDGFGVDDSSAETNPFIAREEKTMMWFSGTVNYIGDSKENETFEYSHKVVFDNDYVFEAIPGAYASTKDLENLEAGDWALESNSATFEPLSSKKTRYFRSCLEVPEQAELDEEKPLVVIYTIDGQDYTYKIR